MVPAVNFQALSKTEFQENDVAVGTSAALVVAGSVGAFISTGERSASVTVVSNIGVTSATDMGLEDSAEARGGVGRTSSGATAEGSATGI